MKKKHSFILGIQCFATMDSGACIIRTNNKTKEYDYIAISEERLIRKKYPYTFPLHSIKYCMDYFNIKDLGKIDLLVSDIIREHVWERSGPSFNVKDFDYIKSILKFPKNKIFQINHHLAHAASVYYTSGFKDSAILIVDGNGTDLETNSFYEGKGKNIKLIDKYKGRGIGVLYGAVSKEILNLGTGGEGKTMGLAPYGRKGNSILNFSGRKFKGIETDYSNIMNRMPFTDIVSLNNQNPIAKFLSRKKKRPKYENILNFKWKKIAYDLQNETEKCFIHLGKEISKKIKSKNICIAGGVALNSVANQKLFDNTNYKNIFIYPACSDSGIPFGLAVWALHNHQKFKDKNFKMKKILNAYSGKKYSNNSVIKLLEENKIKYKNLNLKEVSDYIAKGKIIGWFQGGSEYGPRALGNRSILADSRNPKMKDIVNKRVKHREEYRPFAPAIIEEDYKKFFKLNQPSPFMLLVAKVKKAKIIPAVTHVDGTARVQTVNYKQNKIFYDLIKNFKEKTGIGCILNTSFNDAGEPIVESPLDAIITFLSCDMDFLVINDYLIDIKNLNYDLKTKLQNKRIKKIKDNHNYLLKKFTKNYNLINKKEFIKKQEKFAYWNCLEKPSYDFEKEIIKLKKNKKNIILYGTYSHTKFLLKRFPNLNDLNIKGFIPFKKITENLNHKKLKILKKRQIKKNDYIIITSYEYSYDIQRELDINYRLNDYFKIYNGYSRSIKESDKLKKRIKINYENIDVPLYQGQKKR